MRQGRAAISVEIDAASVILLGPTFIMAKPAVRSPTARARRRMRMGSEQAPPSVTSTKDICLPTSGPNDYREDITGGREKIS